MPMKMKRMVASQAAARGIIWRSEGGYGAAHVEIGVIQQAYDAGITKGQSMTIVV